MSDDFTPPKQLESDRGGSGRSRRTAIGTGGTGGPGGYGGIQSDPSGGDDSGGGHKPRALICDRSLSVRAGLSVILSPYVDVVDHTNDAHLLFELIDAYKPHVVISEIDLENVDPLEHFQYAFKVSPFRDFIVLSDSFNATRNYRRLVNMGLRFYCLKQSLQGTIIAAVQTAIRSPNASYCDPALFALLEQPVLQSALEQFKITSGEFNVLVRLGLRNFEIASELGLKPKQVERCIEALLAKLRVPTRTAAALKVAQLGGIILPKMPSLHPETAQNMEVLAFEALCCEAIEEWLRHGLLNLQYLYRTDNQYTLMDTDTFRQYDVRKDKFESGLEQLKEGDSGLESIIIGNRVLFVRLGRKFSF